MQVLHASASTNRGVDPYPTVIQRIFGAVGPEHWREGSPLDPSCVKLWGRRFKMSSNVMTPVTKANICSSQGKVHLEVQGFPTLYVRGRSE